MKKFEIFDQNHGLTTLKNCKFCDLFKSVFLWLTKASFLSRKPPNNVYRPNLPKKKKINQFKIFDQNHGLTLWKNAIFATFLNRSFYGQDRLVFYRERHQTLFLGEMYLKGNTEEILNF